MLDIGFELQWMLLAAACLCIVTSLAVLNRNASSRILPEPSPTSSTPADRPKLREAAPATPLEKLPRTVPPNCSIV